LPGNVKKCSVFLVLPPRPTPLDAYRPIFPVPPVFFRSQIIGCFALSLWLPSPATPVHLFPFCRFVHGLLGVRFRPRVDRFLFSKQRNDFFPKRPFLGLRFLTVVVVSLLFFPSTVFPPLCSTGGCRICPLPSHPFSLNPILFRLGTPQ